MKLLLSQVLEKSLVYNLHLSDSFFSLVLASKRFLFFRLLLPAGADKDSVGYCTVCDGCSLQLVPSAAIRRWLAPFCFPHWSKSSEFKALTEFLLHALRSQGLHWRGCVPCCSWEIWHLYQRQHVTKWSSWKGSFGIWSCHRLLAVQSQVGLSCHWCSACLSQWGRTARAAVKAVQGPGLAEA